MGTGLAIPQLGAATRRLLQPWSARQAREKNDIRPPGLCKLRRCQPVHKTCVQLLRAQRTREVGVAYNETMKQQMGWDEANPYEYHYERGLYYHEITPNLFCGTQMRNVQDLEALMAQENIDVLLNLQQDKDFDYFGVKFHDIYLRARSMGIDIVRRPAVDFDPHSLRRVLPSAVKVVQQALANGQRVYVHCTAGLGRAPAVCIAHMYWFQGRQLDEAYKALTDIRPCGPKRDAIRGATYDLMGNINDFDRFFSLQQDAYATLSEADLQMLRQHVMQS